MLDALAELAEPRAVTAEWVRAGAELVRIALGSSEIAPEADRRFADPAWQLNPLYRRWAQAYLLWRRVLEQLAAAVESDGDWRRAERARYAATLLAEATAPTNLLAGNPAALKRAFDTAGASLVHGATQLGHDLVRNRGLPAQVDRSGFVVGENLAATPGAVVHRDDMFELIQYGPATARVHERPLLMIPPQVNKHYFLDLAPGRSLVEYVVGCGIQYFTMVWRNPSPADGARGIDDYVGAQLRALEVVQDITRCDAVNLLGVCAGGLTAGLMLGHLAAAGDPRIVNSATFAISMLDARFPNPLGMLATQRFIRRIAADARAGRVYDRREIGRAFAWLRPHDLVFSYVINDWLMGEDPPSFDILAWNADGSDLPARFYAEMLDLYVHNRAAQPGGVRVLGRPVDLARVSCDSFIVSGQTDHITPWRCGYMTSQLLGGRSEVVVTSTGHIQTMVNPPGKPRARYWSGPRPGPDPDAWLAAATLCEGSWWPRYADWLLARSGRERDAPAAFGSRRYPALDPAPGRYVRE